jgi:hypothetical protein
MCRPGTRVIPLGGRTTCITSRPRSPVGAVRCGSRRRRARNSGRATPSLRHEPGVALSSWSTLHFHPVRRAATVHAQVVTASALSAVSIALLLSCAAFRWSAVAVHMHSLCFHLRFHSIVPRTRTAQTVNRGRRHAGKQSFIRMLMTGSAVSGRGKRVTPRFCSDTRQLIGL